MTIGGSSGTPPACPFPPTDLHSRDIPTLLFDAASRPLFRIHKTRFGSVFYTRRGLSDTVYRFDAPAGEYGILYAAPGFDACMAETVIRNSLQVAAPLLERSEVAERSIATLAVVGRQELVLVDLTAPLFGIGGSTEITSVPEYSAPNAWSKAFFDHPAEYDGLYFPSRFSNLPSVALFDRVDVEQRDTTALLLDRRLMPFLDKYHVKLSD